MSETLLHTPQVDIPTAGNAAFLVIEQARRITNVEDLDFLEYRKHIGIPLATAILREWLPVQPLDRPVWLDFRGVRAINLSVAEELGPMLMKHIADQAVLGHHYPVYRGLQHDVAHTMHKAFLEMKWATLAYLDDEEIAEGIVGTRLDRIGNHTIVVLGMLTTGQLRILQFINQRYAERGKPVDLDASECDERSSRVAGGPMLDSTRFTARFSRPRSPVAPGWETARAGMWPPP